MREHADAQRGQRQRMRAAHRRQQVLVARAKEVLYKFPHKELPRRTEY